MTWTIVLLAGFAVGLLLGRYAVNRPVNKKKALIAALIAVAVGAAVSLGVFRQGPAPVADFKAVADGKYFGNTAVGDLDGDGQADTAFLFTQSPGGSGTFYYVIVALQKDGGYVGTNAVLLGDRIAPQTTEIRDGILIVNYADRKADEPFTARPSVGVSKYLRVQGMRLVTTDPQRTVKLFFYDASRDQDASGSVQCTRQGLVPVTREIPLTNTPVQDAVRLLLTTRPTAQEASSGLVSEMPLAGVQLTGASTRGTALTLTFADPDNRTGGGSCFVSILSAQIEETAKQFGGVSQVVLAPPYLFQP